MRPLSLTRLLLGLCLGLAVGLAAARAADDKAKGDTKKTNDNQERVKFNSVDGVQLHGIFYASDRGKRAPCVMLLPKIGSNSSQEGWDQLATELQKAGYAVLLFDYRGHGESTDVDPNFWGDTSTVPLARLTAFNRENVRGGGQNPPKTSISYKDYNKSYYPALVNDVAAAKSYLDQRNNNGDCNSANLILIGAEDGATLGALWLYSDLSLYRATVLNPLNNLPVKFDTTPEGKDVTACVWLTISPTLGTYRPWVTTWMQMAGQVQKVPMAFVYGEKDTTGAAFAQQCFRAAKPSGGKTKLTGEHPVKGSKLAGAALLDDKLDARDWIVNSYLKFVKENAVAPTYDTKDVQKEVYAWILPGTTRPYLIKPMGEKQLPPVPYTAFLR